MNEMLVSLAMSAIGYLYKQRDEILTRGKKALTWWNRPRDIPLLKVSGLIFSEKSGKTSLTNALKDSKKVCFVDVDDYADKMKTQSDSVELAELELTKTIRELVAVKKKTFKHVVLISTDYTRLKSCGAWRCYLCYPSPRFVKNLQNSTLSEDIKKAFQISHSILSFSVGKYDKLKRVFLYDDVAQIEQIIRQVYEVPKTN